ncbi:MAG: hypothetical protein K2J88_05775 [Oscillospiraceae bacterium]|nr:hypothetical protein [Oscillospiraceae bacterium]
MVNLKKKNKKSTKEYFIATGGKVLVLVSVLANFTEIATWTENFIERHSGKSTSSVVELKEVQAVDSGIQEENVAEVAYVTNDVIEEVTFVEAPIEQAVPENNCVQEVSIVDDVVVVEEVNMIACYN